MNGVELITQAEYARRRGVAKSAVARAVKENRISLIDGKVDPSVANIQWDRNTRSRADGGKASGEAAPPGRAAAPEFGRAAGNDTPDLDGDYFYQRTRREKYEADLAEIKLAEQQGDLVRVADVRAEMAKRVGAVRTNLLQIPARLAPLLANEPDQAKCHALLDGELRSVLMNLIQDDHGNL